MTPEEFDNFKSKLDRVKQKNQTDFVLALLYKKPIIVVEDLQPMLKELKRHGNNLNQISRKLNEHNSFGESATKVMNECWKAYRAIAALESELDKVVKNALIQGESKQSEAQESVGLHNQSAESNNCYKSISG